MLVALNYLISKMADSFIYFRMTGYVVTIMLHCVNTVSMTLVLHGEEAVVFFKDPKVKAFNDNQAKFFTCWTFVLQVVYSVIGLTCDCLTLKNSKKEGYKINKHLRGLRDTLFSAIQWPSNFLVFSVFWSLFYIDRELILPETLDKVLSRTSNHIIHTAIIPIVVWELVFRPRPEPKSHRRNVAHVLFHYVLYFTVLFYTYYETGEWIYPVFKRTWGTIYFPCFMAIILILLLVYYYIQWPLTRLIHGSVVKKKSH